MSSIPTIVLPRNLGRLELGESGRWVLRGAGLSPEAKSLCRYANMLSEEMGSSPSLGPSPACAWAVAITKKIKGSHARLPMPPDEQEGAVY